MKKVICLADVANADCIISKRKILFANFLHGDDIHWRILVMRNEATQNP